MYAIVAAADSAQMKAVGRTFDAVGVHNADENMLSFNHAESVAEMIDGRVQIDFAGNTTVLGREGSDTANARIIQVES
ncbi:hypothetical protein HAPG_00070 [Halorubrum phage GNf2]|nr:hypothetical protein HAPG_00070 [Halorubrum phage GNf2]